MAKVPLDAPRMVLIQAASGLDAHWMPLDARRMPIASADANGIPDATGVGDARADALASELRPYSAGCTAGKRGS